MMARIWLRRWRQTRLLTGQFAITIAIGMGGVSALVSLMLALGYQTLPYRDPGRLVAVWERVRSGQGQMLLSGPDLADFASATPNIFSSLGALTAPLQLWLVDRNGATQVFACQIQAGAFSDLGVRPVLGRVVRPSDEPPSYSAISPAWISYRLWRTRYGGSPSVIGATIGVADSAAGKDSLIRRIAGVLPPGASIPLPISRAYRTDVWYLAPRGISARPRAGHLFFGLGRLRPGVSVPQAQAALAVVAQRIGQRHSFDRWRRPVVRGLEPIAQGPARRTIGLLALGVGMVFLVGCVNLAILMGAEGRRRRWEIAIRSALGAGRVQLWREVASEKCLLTLLSLGLGVGSAFELLRVLVWLVPSAGLGSPLEHPPPLNLVVLLSFGLFALAAALIWSALLVSASDAPRSSRTLAAAGGGPGFSGFRDAGPGAGRWRLILLAAQASIGICLLAAVALTAATYERLSTANLGPAPSHTVLMSVNQRDNFVPTDAQVALFNEQVLSRLERLPGTQAIALANIFPPPVSPLPFMKQTDTGGIERETTPPTSVTPGYFRTLGIPILFGRAFEDTDNTGSEPVAIVSLDMAERNWISPGLAVGSEIAFGPKYEKFYRVVGVAANFTGYWLEQPAPTVYLPLAQAAYSCGGEVILRTTTPLRATAALAPQALSGMATPTTISEISTMEERWRATLTRPFARVAGMFLLALLGLGLSVQGVYAVASATAAVRAHDLAVRSALGALPRQLLWEIVRELTLAVTAGTGLGVAAALGLRQLLEHWLGATSVWPAVPIAAAILLLGLAAAAGSYIPARAATRANPVDALRQG